MPIYMDRHEIPDEIKPEHVARMHQEDLKVQHLYGCRGITYWCDSERHTAFCLIEAPNKEAIQQMHNHAHGTLPHHIIEVDARVVESFLGRIEDPEKAVNSELNIIDDPAFRVIMVLHTAEHLHRMEANQLSIFSQKFHRSIAKSIRHFEGSIVQENDKVYLVSFRSVTNAVLCALKILENFKYLFPKVESEFQRLQIGIASGTPVTDQEEIFHESVTKAYQMAEFVKDQIVITTAVKAQYENENRNAIIDPVCIRVLTPNEEIFLGALLSFARKHWNGPKFNIGLMSKMLGYSRSQLYRKIRKLTGKAPNTFIREYRLNKALELLRHQKGNISEIAFESGFSSAPYFTKCFQSTFHILPSKFIQLVK